MTRLARPVVRVVHGNGHDLVVTLTEDAVILRPKRVRRPEAAVALTWAAIYRAGLLARQPTRRRVRRGTLRVR